MKNHLKRHLEKHWVRNTIFFILGGGLIFAGFIFITIATIKIPDLKSFEERKIVKSTKIYDRTGEIVLFDIHESLKRTVIPFTQMGTNIKNAVVAVEDSEFYNHNGVRIDRTLKAIFNNITGGSTQGGSTITQQLIKNSVLTSEKKISRKIKEWMLAYKIEKEMTKDQILETYLNELPYGNIYGIQEASKSFFGKEPADLTLAESAYLAAIPQAPTYYSPYGSHLEDLENRKNFVLKRMKELGFITEEEYLTALAEKVIWKEQDNIKIKAPHFVFYIKEYL
ncbi:MAG TPA: transglycosylase domain-containing protein, partial [Candidatus Paceibacterota bacterium]|nr:transglycosylase domain-containing protein [Candidatus Paceibacterota bacterium]